MLRYIIFSIAIVLLSSCGSTSEEQPAATESQKEGAVDVHTVSFSDEQLKSAGVATGFPTEETASGILSLQGKIEVPPQSTVSLSFPLGGYLRATKMLPGARVRKGQVLAELEDMEFIQLQQDYLTAKERFALAETEYSRQKDLNASKASSDKVYQQSRTEMETQRILMNALAQKLQLIGIDPVKLRADNISKSVAVVSPINGFVSAVNVNVGKYTSPTDMLFELVDPRDIHLMLHVFEKDHSRLSVGQKVKAYTNGNPNKKMDAEIILISKTLDENRMATIHCHFKNYDPALAPGTFMNGEVETGGRMELAVPEEAVVRWENKFYVFVEKRKGEYEMVAVTPGVAGNGRQQIQSASLKTNTPVVVENAYAVLMKMKNTEEGE